MSMPAEQQPEEIAPDEAELVDEAPAVEPEAEVVSAEEPADESSGTPSPSAPPTVRVRADVVARLQRYAALFAAAAQESGIPVAWLKGIAAAESSGNADSGKGRGGYLGLMQAQRTADQLDPATSIRTGAKKLADFVASLKKHLGAAYTDLPDLEALRVLAMGYNAGPGVVYKATDYARAAGDVTRWRDPEHYTRALVYHGSYSTGAYAPKGTQKEELADAERWRRKSRYQDLTLADLQRQGAPALVLRAVAEKQKRTAPYLDKIVAYARSFEGQAPAVS